ncbi:MAG: diguanylate cyclase [Nitrospiria bacterium]
MQATRPVSNNVLIDIQNCLASLSPFSILIYDPVTKKPITPLSRAGVLNHLIQTNVSNLSCVAEFEKVLDRAVSSEKIAFSSCPDHLHFFAVPIRVKDNAVLALVAGKTVSDTENLSSHRDVAAKLASAGRLLLANAFRPGQEAVPSSKVLKEKHARPLPDLHDKDEIARNLSMLFDALGALYHLNSAVVFNQVDKGAPYEVIAAFGEKKERLSRLKVHVDFLVRPYLRKTDFVYIDTKYELKESGFHESISSCALFPIYQEGGAVLILAILNTPLAEKDAETIVSLCKKAGTVHENIVLKRQLSRYREAIQSFSDLKKIIESPPRLEPVFEQFLQLAVQTLDAERGSIMLLDDDKNELSIKALAGSDRSLLTFHTIKPGEGIAGRVFQEGRGILVDDRNHYYRLKRKPKPAYRTAYFVSVPIQQKNKTIGLINVADKISGRPFSKEDLAVLEAIGGYIAIALERSALYRKTKRLKQISITDPLTGLLNRRTFHERLLEEIERTRRHQVPVSLIMMDLDDFKRINDTYGHQEGDELLKVLGNAIRQYIRSIDVPSRYGGEEFTVILPQTRKEDAWIIADRLCKGIKQQEIRPKEASDAKQLAVSVGLATFPDDADSLEQLVRNADRALYQAKLQGKNRAIAFSKETFN